jgi:hypothetical protein
MRLWSLHPKNLDRMGLLAVWREGLLAQAVLAGKTKGYRNHPQLERFMGKPGAIQAYLIEIWEEGKRRGYSFDRRKIGPCSFRGKIRVTEGQIGFELAHLKKKVEMRAPNFLAGLSKEVNPVFKVVPGPVERWERFS